MPAPRLLGLLAASAMLGLVAALAAPLPAVWRSEVAYALDPRNADGGSAPAGALPAPRADEARARLGDGPASRAPAGSHRVRRGETLYGIARRYGVSVAVLAALNGLRDPNRLEAGRVLLLPSAPGSAAAEPSPPEAPLVWPVAGDSTVTSGFGRRWGRFHHGVDIAAPLGAPVGAVLAGRVVFTGWRGAYGRLVILEHAGGWRSYYAHLARIDVRPGQRVSAGTVIGRVGSSGHSTGPHVHLELHVDGRPVDPLPWLRR